MWNGGAKDLAPNPLLSQTHGRFPENGNGQYKVQGTRRNNKESEKAKMNKMKKIMALALSFMMVVAMNVVSFAAEATGKTYTITAPANSHVYEIYQIFTGDVNANQDTLSNVKWGKNGIGTTGDEVAQDVLDALEAVSAKTDSEKLTEITKYATLKDAYATISGDKAGYAVSASVPGGYYLIKDEDATVSGSDTYTTYIVRIVGDIKIKSKSGVPDFNKKVKDTNDTTGGQSDWQDSADYDIGDAVPFKLTGTVADNYDDYKTYYFAFHDKQEKGLTFNADSVKVYVGDSLITSGYTVNTNQASMEDGCTFEVVFSDLKSIASVKAGTKITVEYTATLNEDAVLGNKGNLNTGSLEFSNNPNEEQGGHSTGKTPDDTVIVFTYKVVVDKVDNNKEPLKGAEFTLAKTLVDGTTKVIGAVKAGEGTKFTFSGLDDGEYTLTETVTPDGYNKIDPITFTVTADHEVIWTVTDRTDMLTKLEGKTTAGADLEFTKDLGEGSLSAEIVNQKGSTLPTTGGIGTTIFYVIGSVLVLGAAVLLITKKRMSAR